jgi:hypothetical protein
MKVFLIVAAVAASAYLERGNTDDSAIQYCEMTSIWQTTHGASGWPPYLGVKCEVAHAN